MKLQENEYGIGTLCKGGKIKDAIIITREALERLREDAERRSNEMSKIGAETLSAYYDGEASFIIELLLLIEDETPL